MLKSLFPSPSNKPAEFAVSLKGKSGCILYGPYIKLSSGRYSVQFEVTIDEPATGAADIVLGYVDVVINNGNDLLAKTHLFASKLGSGLID